MANEKRLIPLNKRIVYGGDVFNSLMSEKGWSATEASDFVKEFRTVDAVEVVHGQWLYDSGREHYFCSACNEDAFHTSIDNPVYDYDWEENLRYSHTETIYEEHLTDYCPNCGAKMDGERREGE